MKVSIIIPTYNGGPRISQVLSALEKQSIHSDFEIIVVDDGSTDNTSEIVSGFDGVKLISQENKVPAAAINHGEKVSNGDILLFKDDDFVNQHNA